MKLFSGRKKRRIIALCVLAAVVLAAALDVRMVTRFYRLDAPEINAPVRIALVTDLHSCNYGRNQARLVEAVHAQQPDLVLLGGDIFDDKFPDGNTEAFIAGITGKYPIYYVTGNHEYWAGAEKFAAKMAILEKHSVPMLSGEWETIEINGQHINICGVDDPYAYPRKSRTAGMVRQLDRVCTAAENGCYTILLSHRPELFEIYAAYDFDLVLSGHAHGGQWRIPGILNGLYAPNQGIFPKYTGGEYAMNGTTMIVSRGLARESTRVPRIFNRPELVIIEIT